MSDLYLQARLRGKLWMGRSSNHPCSDHFDGRGEYDGLKVKKDEPISHKKLNKWKEHFDQILLSLQPSILSFEMSHAKIQRVTTKYEYPISFIGVETDEIMLTMRFLHSSRPIFWMRWNQNQRPKPNRVQTFRNSNDHLGQFAPSVPHWGRLISHPSRVN